MAPLRKPTQIFCTHKSQIKGVIQRSPPTRCSKVGATSARRLGEFVLEMCWFSTEYWGSLWCHGHLWPQRPPQTKWLTTAQQGITRRSYYLTEANTKTVNTGDTSEYFSPCCDQLNETQFVILAANFWSQLQSLDRVFAQTHEQTGRPSLCLRAALPERKSWMPPTPNIQNEFIMNRSFVCSQ